MKILFTAPHFNINKAPVVQGLTEALNALREEFGPRDGGMLI